MMKEDEDKIFYDIANMNKMAKDILKYTNKDYQSFFNGESYDMA